MKELNALLRAIENESVPYYKWKLKTKLTEFKKELKNIGLQLLVLSAILCALVTGKTK